jgi:CarD family transcriptional regulator
MMEALVTFEVGDHVVYPSQGGGVIKETTFREIQGTKHEYLKVVFARGDMEVLVPRDRAEEVGLRHTVSAGEVQRLAYELAQGELTLPVHWPPRFRAEQDILGRGDAYELARLVRVLTLRNIEKGLAGTEREVLENARTLLASELAIVLENTVSESEEWIDAALEQSL